MRLLTDLVESNDPAWPEIEAAVAASPYPVVTLAADPQRADEELLWAQVTTRSWLGAVVHRSGGLVIDHGWLRVLGSGNNERHLASLSEINDSVTSGVIVAQDVLGGQFAWRPNTTGKPTICYLAPDTMDWEDCERGYGDWLAAMLGGATTAFYKDLRWPGWVDDVQACRLDHAISLWPPPWTREGKDLSAASRRPVPMSEAMSLIGVTRNGRSPA
ncbi:uncharacterized protein DUF2625 [Krasilnikovia cinnamomea]|uniref:Uncharacterized protein DUF2625 n=1 Tax=Krasilnikovia cinnamomea TaxID=349313 RepID=A0A4Q7ZEP1_9ACTN|nr:DUF2625 family protein [Krasilnikovia cinnamomea]RZU48754.1 uncharacterized protein DUF2625 [Krasilnikovia cinnamomea]